MSNCFRALVLRLLVCGAALAMMFGEPPACVAADLPTLGDIRSHWSTLRDVIQSLYVETAMQETSPMPLEELRRLPGYENFPGCTKAERQFAFKGEK